MKKLAWSSSAYCFSQIPTSGPQLQVNFDIDKSDPFGVRPGVYTIEFSVGPLEVVDSTPGVDNRATFPVAEITWSVEGNSVKRIIALNNGTTISGTGQGVKVKVYDGYTPSATQNKYKYLVNIQVTPGLRSATTPVIYATSPQVLQFGAGVPFLPSSYFLPGVITLAPADKVGFSIPQSVGVNTYRIFASACANDVSVPIRQETVLTGNVTNLKINEGCYFFPGGAGFLGARGTKAFLLLNKYNDTGWLPISPGSQGLIIENLNAGGGDNCFLNLIWGIEG